MVASCRANICSSAVTCLTCCASPICVRSPVDGATVARIKTLPVPSSFTSFLIRFTCLTCCASPICVRSPVDGAPVACINAVICLSAAMGLASRASPICVRSPVGRATVACIKSLLITSFSFPVRRSSGSRTTGTVAMFASGRAGIFSSAVTCLTCRASPICVRSPIDGATSACIKSSTSEITFCSNFTCSGCRPTPIIVRSPVEGARVEVIISSFGKISVVAQATARFKVFGPTHSSIHSCSRDTKGTSAFSFDDTCCTSALISVYSPLKSAGISTPRNLGAVGPVSSTPALSTRVSSTSLARVLDSGVLKTIRGHASWSVLVDSSSTSTLSTNARMEASCSSEGKVSKSLGSTSESFRLTSVLIFEGSVNDWLLDSEKDV
ncbi:unnamed protein product [Ixodes hexagonus]